MRNLIALFLLAILAAAPAAAQDVFYRFEQRAVASPPDDQVFTVPVPPPPGGGMIEHGIGLLAVEPFDAAKPVTGAPYSADVATDVVQPLADGNRIERHTTSSVARDGRGRVRREQQLTAIGPILPQVNGRIITIMDPVARVSYSLDPARRVAMRSPLPDIKRLQTVVKRGDGVARAAVAAGVAAGVPAPGVSGAIRGAEVVAMKEAGNNVRTESLGTAQIEGIEAQGTRSVVTIEAGTIGNQAPIEIVSEQWFSPEIGEVVLSRRSDPRFGETTYRLRNIVRAEPSPELFEVPADYTVEALPAFGVDVNVTKPGPAR